MVRISRIDHTRRTYMEDFCRSASAFARAASCCWASSTLDGLLPARSGGVTIGLKDGMGSGAPFFDRRRKVDFFWNVIFGFPVSGWESAEEPFAAACFSAGGLLPGSTTLNFGFAGLGG